MTPWDILAWTSLTQPYMVLTTGQTCDAISKTCISPPALTANETSPAPLKYLDHSIRYQFLSAEVTVSRYNCILSITDCLHSDIHIIPTHTTITTEDLALLFFKQWYC